MTHIPKMCQAPNLKSIRFAYHPLASIELKAFDHLPNLQSLDLAGNAVIVPMTTILADTLSMSASFNFSNLDMSRWDNLKNFEPGWIKNMKPYSFIDFLDSGIETIEKEAFYDVFQILASYDGLVEDPYNPSGHICFGRNPLRCDCSIKWIVEDPDMLKVIDFGPYDFNRPKCKDGTLVADLDLEILEALCPDD